MHASSTFPTYRDVQAVQHKPTAPPRSRQEPHAPTPVLLDPGLRLALPQHCRKIVPGPLDSDQALHPRAIASRLARELEQLDAGSSLPRPEYKLPLPLLVVPSPLSPLHSRIHPRHKQLEADLVDHRLHVRVEEIILARAERLQIDRRDGGRDVRGHRHT